MQFFLAILAIFMFLFIKIKHYLRVPHLLKYQTVKIYDLLRAVCRAI